MHVYEPCFPLHLHCPCPHRRTRRRAPILARPLSVHRAAGTSAPDPGARGDRLPRCAKSWLAGQDTERALGAIGLPLEIVPLAIPGSEAILPARVLWNGRPLPGALVKAWRAPLGPGGALTDGAARDSLGVGWQGRADTRG